MDKLHREHILLLSSEKRTFLNRNYYGARDVFFQLWKSQKDKVILLIVGCLAAVVVNYGCAISFSAAILFPIICSVQLRSMAAFAMLTVCSMAIT